MSLVPLVVDYKLKAEPAYRYRPGGYHPVHLGDTLSEDRYKILHKLGWGGYSTVWAAQDQRSNRLVAIKICVANESKKAKARIGKEVEALQAVSSIPAEYPGSSNLLKMLDYFTVEGPNGSHACLVLELLGPSILDMIDCRCGFSRLPARVAKSAAQQSLAGLSALHHHNIAHGDIHAGNLAFAIPGLDKLDESALMLELGGPEIGPITRADGSDIAPNLPRYLVKSVSFRVNLESPSFTFKLIDFGQSFIHNDPPAVLHTPMAVRAPEVVFGDPTDYHVDLWGMGCLIFELFVGQLPFDSSLIYPLSLIDQIFRRIGNKDPIPDRWLPELERFKADNIRSAKAALVGRITKPALEEWLRKCYLSNPHWARELTERDLKKLGRILRSMLRFEPAARQSAQELAENPWWTSTNDNRRRGCRRALGSLVKRFRIKNTML